MRKPEYRKALKVARNDLEKLFRQREDLERKIARTRETVISLQLLVEHDPKYDDATYLPENLTAAVQYALVAAKAPMAPVDIRRHVERIGFDIGSSNPLASVYSVLKRLVEQRIIRKVYQLNPGGKTYVRIPFYWWGDYTDLPKGWVAVTDEQVAADFAGVDSEIAAMQRADFDKATKALSRKRAKGVGRLKR